jgi:hypothetical protein
LLNGIDLSEYNNAFMFECVEEVDKSEVDPEGLSMLMYEMPYLEHLNFFLREHHLRLVNLGPFENAYILCVKDDAGQIEQLDRCLERFDMEVYPRDPMDQQQATEHIRQLLTS